MIAGFNACDSTTAPDDKLEDAPAIVNLNVSPTSIQFSPVADGVKDTTIDVSVQARVINLEESKAPNIIIKDRSDGSTILNDVLVKVDDESFAIEVPFPTKTTFFKKYLLSVYVHDDNGNGNYAQSNIALNGFSVINPVILEADNPASVQRPSTGESLVSFKAKVTDEEGQDTVEGVFLRLISQVSGEVSDSPFSLYDDGTQSSGDHIAGDSIYTVTFPFNSDNQLQTYDIHYYAVDKGGLVSDTVKTTFSIVE